MKDNEKQVFTRREIEIDLKYVYKRGIPIVVYFFIFIVISTVIIWLHLDMPNTANIATWACFILFFVLIIAIFCLLIYYIYRYYSPIKYEIVIGTYESQYPAPKTSPGSVLLSFKLYGEYPLRTDNGFLYYTWSERNAVIGSGIQKTITRGDDYYLIMINNKIAYIYSKRMFEFKETM